jgi:molybdenum cofactor cytidylyltransferase
MQFPLSNQYGIILLAAGKSSRLGMPKQLLLHDGATLIKRAATIALEITNNVVVVTGAETEKLEKELRSLPLQIIHNTAFEEGIASSIRIGITSSAVFFGGLRGVIFIVCDQPYLSASVLRKLLETSVQTNKGIVACAYADTLGIPVLFQSEYFDRLLNLKGDVGAKTIIQESPEDVATVDFPLGNVDIDTMQDYENLIKTEANGILTGSSPKISQTRL